jgi:hypothetical protein
MHELHTNPPAESQTSSAKIDAEIPNPEVEASWTTRVEPELTRPFAVEELHQVCFEPNGWPGKGEVVTLLIPECEMQTVWTAADGEPVALVNRPQKNRSVKYWLRSACKEATAKKAFLVFSCDTVEQAQRIAKRALKLLPHHRRMALERMFDPPGRNRRGLS